MEPHYSIFQTPKRERSVWSLGWRLVNQSPISHLHKSFLYDRARFTLAETSLLIAPERFELSWVAPTDFKSVAYANFAKVPHQTYTIILPHLDVAGRVFTKKYLVLKHFKTYTSDNNDYQQQIYITLSGRALQPSPKYLAF
jgi:hypothetical protein